MGIDLAETTDLVAFAFYFPETGGLLNVAYISEIPGLEDRMRVDHMDYSKVPRDVLRLCGRRVIDFNKLAEQYLEFVSTFNIQRVGADPWRLKRFVEALEDRDHRPGVNRNPEIVEVRQTYSDIGDCILGFERGLRSGYVQHGGNPLLQRAMVVARVVKDGANNKKFMKNKSFGRIDPLVASAMAFGMSERGSGVTSLARHHRGERDTTEVYGL